MVSLVGLKYPPITTPHTETLTAQRSMIYCRSLITAVRKISYINGVSTPTHQTVLSGSASFALYENEAQTFFTVCSWRVALNCLLNSRATSLMSECAWISSLNFPFFTRPLGNVKRIRVRRRGGRGRFEWKDPKQTTNDNRADEAACERGPTAQSERRDQTLTPGVTCLIQTEFFRLVHHQSDENLNKVHNNFEAIKKKLNVAIAIELSCHGLQAMMSYFRL